MIFNKYCKSQTALRLLLIVLFLAASAVGSLNVYGQSIKGNVRDVKGTPIAYANVVLLNSSDSSFIQGVVSGVDGSFVITPQRLLRQYLLKVSYIGYRDYFQHVDPDSYVNVNLKSDDIALKEVVVKAHARQYKMNSDGISAEVENTILSKLGTAEDVLAHIPGLFKTGEGFEVFGKGAPLFYINGRKVRNLSELDRLKSEDIKSIKVVTNPGSKYDASVGSVVLIQTKRIIGDGFGFDLRSSYFQSKNVDLIDEADWNYRHNGLDLFGTFHYSLMNNYNPSHVTTISQTDTLWRQDAVQDHKTKNQSYLAKIGANYVLDDHNSLGAYYQLDFDSRRGNTFFYSDVSANGRDYDRLETHARHRSSPMPSHQVNLYYVGSIGKLSVDLNADYYKSNEKSIDTYSEKSRDRESRILNTENDVNNELYAAKLTLSYPLGPGRMSAGGEYTYTHRQDDYINQEKIIPSSYSKFNESNIAPFIGYNCQIADKIALSMGLRYERVQYDYYRNGKHADDQSRIFRNLFPNISISAPIGKVQTSIGYSITTNRPSYDQLSNNYTYGNRFIWQTGNPRLKHEYIHNVDLSGMWKFFQARISYKDTRDAILFWTKQIPEQPSVTLLTRKNIPSLKQVSAQLVAFPRWGRWSTQSYVALVKPWLTVHEEAKELKFDKPIWVLGSNNTFDLGRGWTASLDVSFTSKGNAQNVDIYKPKGYVDASVSKEWQGGRWSLQLKGNDIFNSRKDGSRIIVERLMLEQKSWFDSQEISITLRYKFNVTRNKYKGTGAGNAEKERL